MLSAGAKTAIRGAIALSRAGLYPRTSTSPPSLPSLPSVHCSSFHSSTGRLQENSVKTKNSTSSAAGLHNHPQRREVGNVLHQRPWQRIEVPSLVSSLTTTYKTVEEVDGVACPLATPKQGAVLCTTYSHHTPLVHTLFFGELATPQAACFFALQLGTAYPRKVLQRFGKVWQRFAMIPLRTCVHTVPCLQARAGRPEHGVRRGLRAPRRGCTIA
jgi:hypothetical protein